jgi:hypothetical protein
MIRGDDESHLRHWINHIMISPKEINVYSYIDLKSMGSEEIV